MGRASREYTMSNGWCADGAADDAAECPSTVGVLDVGGAGVVVVASSILGRFSSKEKDDDADGIEFAANEFVVDCGT